METRECGGLADNGFFGPGLQAHELGGKACTLSLLLPAHF